MRVALYVRVSTQRQAQQQNVEQQVERLRAQVAAHVEEEGWEVREEHVFRDDGYSGATLRRPGLDRLRDGRRLAGAGSGAGDGPGPPGAQLCPPDAAP